MGCKYSSEAPDWLKRLDAEFDEVLERIKRLALFIDTHPAPDDISCAAQILLKKQLEVMKEYKDILYVRLCLANAELSLEKDDNPALQ